MKKTIITGAILFAFNSYSGLMPVIIPNPFNKCMRGLEKLLAVEIYVQNTHEKNTYEKNKGSYKKEDSLVVVAHSGTDRSIKKSEDLTYIEIYTNSGMITLHKNVCSLGPSKIHTSALNYLSNILVEIKPQDITQDLRESLILCKNITTEDKDLIDIKDRVEWLLNYGQKDKKSKVSNAK